MLGDLEGRMKQESDQVKAQLSVAVDSLGVLGTRVDRAEKRLDGLVEEVNLIVEKKLAGLPGLGEGQDASEGPPGPSSGASSYAGVLAAASASPLRAQQCPEKRREDDYWRCRRALRLRPVGKGDLVSEVGKFLTEFLGLSSEFLESVGTFSAKRVPAGPSSKFTGEVVVHFQTTDIRDAVKGAARNLAGRGPEYGVRLELPNHLKSAMKTLQSVSYELKTKYPGAKRNVLFDDETMDLVLDFCLGDDKPWKRMTSGQAKLRKRKGTTQSKLTLEVGELDRILDGSGSEGEVSE